MLTAMRYLVPGAAGILFVPGVFAQEAQPTGEYPPSITPSPLWGEG
jgi:hypothetical protein